MSSHSILETWDSFELGDRKLTDVGNKYTSNWQPKLKECVKYLFLISERKGLTLTESYLASQTWQVKRT